MKKTPIFTVNLKKSFAIFYSFVFCTSLVFSIIFSNAQKKIYLSRELIEKILITANVSIEKCNTLSSVFPLVSYENIKKEETSEKTVSEKNDILIKPVVKKEMRESDNIKITNSANINIDTLSLTQSTPEFLKKAFAVLIIHSHTTESYTPSEKYPYTPTDTYRTQDKNYNMVRVGNKIESILTENGIKVYHCEKTNDYPSYNQSYNNSLTEAEKLIKEHSEIKIIIDVHRDAVESVNGEEIKYVSDIDGSLAACLMLVVGSNSGGLKHDNWQDNMSFAVQLQNHLNSLYPTLMRPLNFRSQRFNQHLAPGAIILEVGTNGNTLEEALLGAECFAEGLVSFIKNAGRS